MPAAAADTAILAGGCFWCMEPPYDKLDGVLSTTSGYTSGAVVNQGAIRSEQGDVLLIGRLVGLMAHAIDQAIDGSPIRARLRYVGPRPASD
jgi:hypothetical protein